MKVVLKVYLSKTILLNDSKLYLIDQIKQNYFLHVAKA